MEYGKKKIYGKVFCKKYSIRNSRKRLQKRKIKGAKMKWEEMAVWKSINNN